MSAEILPFSTSNPPAPIAGYVHIGSSGHRQIANLVSAGRVSIKHAVFDACHIDQQQELLELLREHGSEIVLDTKIAELSALGRFNGSCRKLPWANDDRPLSHDDFKNSGDKIINQIADFAVARGVDVLLSPTRLNESYNSSTLKADFDLCEKLRSLLDQNGGKDISLDFPLLTRMTSLSDKAVRSALCRDLKNLPYDYLWMKLGGFGYDCSPTALRRLINVVPEFHDLGKQVVIDQVGGMAALALVSFGAVSGIGHGITLNEKFDISDWNKFSDGSGFIRNRYYFPALDRLLYKAEAEELMSLKGARSLLACNDRNCCPLGFQDTLKEPKAHFLNKRQKQIEAIEKIKPERRHRFFLEKILAPTDRTARQAARLNASESLSKILKRTSERLDKFRAVLEDLSETRGDDVVVPPMIKERSVNHGKGSSTSLEGKL